MSAFSRFLNPVRGDGAQHRIRQHLLRFEVAVQRELERFLETARRGDGVAGAADEERQLAAYVEGLLEELGAQE